MVASKTPLVGAGYFQWNAGGWFGSLLGGSAWMLVTSYFLVINGQALLASIPAAGFALIMVGAVRLWSRRHRLDPFPALMTLLGLLAVAIPVVWCVVQWYASPLALAAMNWPESPWVIIFVFALVPSVMLRFLVLEKFSTNADSRNRPGSNAVA